RAQLAVRGKNLGLHPVKVNKVSTPNRGAGFEPEGENRVRLKDAGALGAFDIATTLPKLSEPITGLRVVVHPLPELPGGGWGYGPVMAGGRPRAKKAKQATAAAEATDDAPDENAPKKGTFMLTAIAATADA